MTKLLSLADLDAVSASDTPFEFEYILPDGTGSGVFLQVLGSQSEKVTTEVNKLVNARRKQQAQAEAVKGRSPAGADFVPIESDLEFGHKLTAVRLFGWRGIGDTFTPENALRLVSRNSAIAEQITAASNDIGNFTPASSKA